MEKIYALYKGEECLGIGTIKELANLTKVKERTIRFYNTGVYKRRREKSKYGNYRTLVYIGNDDE